MMTPLPARVDELGWRVDQAKTRGIVYGVEAHIGSIVPQPETGGEANTAGPPA